MDCWDVICHSLHVGNKRFNYKSFHLTLGPWYCSCSTMQPINLVEWAADSPISYWYLGGQLLGQPTSVDEPKISRETLAKLFSYPLRSAWTRVSTKDTCVTKMRLSQQWLFPCLNRKEYCMPRTKDLPKTDKLMQKVYEILFSVYDFIWIC